MHRDRTDHECQWVKEIHYREFKCVMKKQYGSSSPMNEGKNTCSVRDSEEYMKNKFQKKKEFNNACFENNEAQCNLRKLECYGENELKGKNKSDMSRDEYQSYRSDEERKR